MINEIKLILTEEEINIILSILKYNEYYYLEN